MALIKRSKRPIGILTLDFLTEYHIPMSNSCRAIFSLPKLDATARIILLNNNLIRFASVNRHHHHIIGHVHLLLLQLLKLLLRHNTKGSHAELGSVLPQVGYYAIVVVGVVAAV